MADKKSVGHAYNIDFLNVVFAASSLFLFFSSLWMVWDDYDREWKGYQRQFVLLETEVTQAGLAAAQGAVDQAELARLQGERDAAEQSVAGNQAQIDELQGQLDEVEAELFLANQAWTFTKAEYDVERYTFEDLQDHDPEHAAEERPAIDAMYAEWIDLGRQVDALNAQRDGLRGQIGEFTGQLGDLDTQIRELMTETTRLEDRLVDLAPSVVTNMLNAPLLDFMAPTLTVRQVITPGMVDDVNFNMRVAKMDRCQSCHLAIDRAGYEDYPQPFTTHPNLDAYVGSASSHPAGEFGCTVCHEGMGQSINFEYASHTPRDAEQMLEWEEEHHWEVPHLWDYPMLPTDMTEASCAKCHQETTFVPEGPDISLAYGVYERAGCYACHTTTGFQGLRKPGPNLTKISTKLDQEWVANWIRDPRAVKSSTWMPRVWYNSNSSSPEDAVGTRQRSTPSSPICSRTPATTNSPSRHRRLEMPSAVNWSSSPWAVWPVTSTTTWTVLRPAPDEPLVSRSRISGTRPPSSGFLIGFATPSTSVQRPTCLTCGSPTRRSPMWRPT